MPFQRKKRPANAAPLTPDEVLQKLEHFCAFRERSPQEVRERILELGLKGQDAEQIYEVLQSDGFFNEERFVNSFVTGKFRYNHWGRVRIKQELRRHQIDPVLLQQALELIDEEEYRTVLEDLLTRKLARYPEDDYSRRDKAAAAVSRLGFEMHLIFEALDHLRSAKDNPEGF